MPTDNDDDAVNWSRDTQKIAVLTWISFLSASAFAVLLFAYIDPLVVVDAINLPSIDSSNAGYAIGFFFLWLHAWVSGWLVLRLVRRKRNWPKRP